MITNDNKFNDLVLNIADTSAYNSGCVGEDACYLWLSKNWPRIKETSQGKFLREVHSKVPDLMLLSLYRQEVLRVS